MFTDLMKMNRREQSIGNCGFHIDNLNSFTFLYDGLKKNNIAHAADYFSNINQCSQYTKWLYPIHCSLPYLDIYEKTIAPVRSHVEKYNGYYFFDISCEAITLAPLDSFLSQLFKSFHEMLEKNNINPKKVYFISANLAADRYYDDWLKNMNINYRIENPILTHHHALYFYSDSFKKYFTRDNLYQKLTALFVNSIQNNIKRKYHFTCLMLRPRTYRTAIMLHLLERGHLEKGIVSYFGNEFGGPETLTVDSESSRYEMIKDLKSGNRLVSMWDKLNQISPITIDATMNQIKQNGWAPEDLGFFPRDFMEDLTLNTKSYFEIVTETHFSDASCLYLTEKTWWPIVSFQPFIMVGSPFTLQYLRDLGFQTFSPFIDESYDAVVDPNLRIELIMAEIDRLCSMSIDELHELYCDMWPRLLYNFQLYIEKSKEIAIKEIRKRILTPINQNG